MQRWMRWCFGLGLVLGLLMQVTGCSPTAAYGEPRSMRVVRTDLTAAGDTAFVTVRWIPATVTDNLGAIDGQRLVGQRLVPAPVATTTLALGPTVTTATIALPTGLTLPGTASGDVCAYSTRRGRVSAKNPLACVTWTAAKADADPPAPTGMQLDSTRLSLSRTTDSVTLMVELPGRKLREVVASGACATSGAACFAALVAGPDTLRPACGRRLDAGLGRAVYVVADPDTTSARWLDCTALAVQYGGTPTLATNALRTLGFRY